MAIPDLLWACPVCRQDRGLQPEGRDHRCHACGTRFRRGEGATIEARAPDGSRTVRRPTEWLTLLPDPEAVVRQQLNQSRLIRHAKADVRWVVGWRSIHDRDGYLNRIEIWGDPTPGEVALSPDALIWTPHEGEAVRWPLGEIGAVQASSRALQVRGKGIIPLAQFDFENDSIFLWERLLHVALRDFYGRKGRGEIVEFQPRIVTR